MFDDLDDDEYGSIPCPMGQCLVGSLLGSIFGYISYLTSTTCHESTVSGAIAFGLTIGVVSSATQSQNPCDASCRELLLVFIFSAPFSWFLLRNVLILCPSDSGSSWGLAGIVLASTVSTAVQYAVRFLMFGDLFGRRSIEAILRELLRTAEESASSSSNKYNSPINYEHPKKTSQAVVV
jgi:hypothetical protein